MRMQTEIERWTSSLTSVPSERSSYVWKLKEVPALSKEEFAEKIRNLNQVALLVLKRGDCSARFLCLLTVGHLVRRECFVDRLFKIHWSISY